MVSVVQDMAGHHKGQVRLEVRSLWGRDTHVQVHEVRSRVETEVRRPADTLRIVRVRVLEQEEDEEHEGTQQEDKEGLRWLRLHIW